MSQIFGINEVLLDKELSYFISSNRIQCRIDKVNGVIQTTNKNSKKQEFVTILEKADRLLTQIQMLTRVINT